MTNINNSRFLLLSFPLILLVMVVLSGPVLADDEDDEEEVKPEPKFVVLDLTRYKVSAVNPVKPAVLALTSRGWTVTEFDKTRAIGFYAPKSHLSRVSINYSNLKQVTFRYIDKGKDQNLDYLKNLSRDYIGGYLSCRFIRR